MNKIDQLIYGSLLGDGCIIKHSKPGYFRFAEGHAEKQKDYLVWKRGMFPFYSSLSEDRKLKAWRLISRPIKELQAFYELKYERIEPLELIDKLDLFGLLIWFLDDGSMGYNSGSLYATLCISGFGGRILEKECVERVAVLLRNKFGLNFKVCAPKPRVTTFSHGVVGNQMFSLNLNSKETEKFLRMMSEFVEDVPQCMLYKLGKDEERMKRGKRYSEVKAQRKHDWYDTIWDIRHLSSDGKVLWQESKHNDLVDEGERSIIMSYFRAEELPTAFYARLAYDSISLTDSLSDVQNEPSGNGYDPIILERSSVGFPTIQQDAGDWRVVSKQITFTATVGNWGKVNVLFLATTSDNLGKLIACVPLTMTRVMNAGDSLVATIRIKLR